MSTRQAPVAKRLLVFAGYGMIADELAKHPEGATSAEVAAGISRRYGKHSGWTARAAATEISWARRSGYPFARRKLGSRWLWFLDEPPDEDVAAALRASSALAADYVYPSPSGGDARRPGIIDARALLESLVGETLATESGRANTVLRVEGDDAVIATARSPRGQPLPIAQVQAALDRIGAGERVPLDPANVGYRSVAIAAILRAVPFVTVDDQSSPATACLAVDADLRAEVLAEFEWRWRAYGELLKRGDPAHASPTDLRELGIYGGASGIWMDSARTRGIGGSGGVTVSVLHTGRHYPDDLSEDALLYHYPETNRRIGRDAAEIAGTKVAARLQLPIFVLLQEGARRHARKGWVTTWYDDRRLFLIEFGPRPTPVVPESVIDSTPFELFEDKHGGTRMTRTRPNQQRFKITVLQRYGGQCALCDVDALELIHAAHLVSDSERGTSDPRNGLPLCANHHLALDRGIAVIEPVSTRVCLVAGLTSRALGVRRPDLTHLRAQPAEQALRYRWDQRDGDAWEPVSLGNR